MESLSTKTVLLTGGGSRLGKALSLGCARAGLRTAVHFHLSQKEAEDTVCEIRENGGTAEAFCADLSKQKCAEALAAEVEARFGLPDYLVCAQSLYSESSLLNFTSNELAAESALTGMSHLFLSRAWFERGAQGAVVHVLDARITDNDSAHAAYHLAKRMLYGITRASAIELAPRVRVNAAAPGLVLALPNAPDTLPDKASRAAPLGRTGSPEAVVDTVLFLLKSNFITGQVIFTDGGRNMRGSVY
jgi:pteridine reductase